VNYLSSVCTAISTIDNESEQPASRWCMLPPPCSQRPRCSVGAEPNKSCRAERTARPDFGDGW
jgi:hypothetical protein